MDSVAKRPGVTRLTVYNHFGSRRGLLAAVFDDVALRGGLPRLNAVLPIRMAARGLGSSSRFCSFWSSDSALGSLHDAMAIDAEFGQALRDRSERRRDNLAMLLGRALGGRGGRNARADAVDLMYTLTSCAATDRSPTAVPATRSQRLKIRMRRCPGAADPLNRTGRKTGFG
nr:TetR family transcriptional regulator [Bradyrhizobium sp. 156]